MNFYSAIYYANHTYFWCNYTILIYNFCVFLMQLNLVFNYNNSEITYKDNIYTRIAVVIVSV